MKKLFNIFFILSFFMLSFFTVNSEEGTQKDFEIDHIEVISFSKIKVIFSVELDSSIDANRDFSVFNRKNNLDELTINKIELDEFDNKNLFINFSENAKPDQEYELNVLELSDKDGRNIEYGIKGIEFFKMPIAFNNESDKNTTLIKNEIKETNINNKESIKEPSEKNEVKEELNTAKENIDIDKEKSIKENNNISGKNIKEDKIVKNAFSESKKNGKLPNTGPGYSLILILSVILGTLIFIFKYKKV